MKRSSILITGIFLVSSCLFAQVEVPQQIPETYEEAPVLENYESLGIDPIGFSDSEAIQMNKAPIRENFDRKYWESIYRNVSFEDDTLDSKERKDKEKKQAKDFNPNLKVTMSLDWLWYGLSLAILLILIIFLIQFINRRNIRNRSQGSDYLIDDDMPDEDALRRANLSRQFDEAYQAGDYKSAYRLRYLNLLKQLIELNLIVYKKEKTNFDYLMQLGSHPISREFGKLTLAFDAIWYGDLVPAKSEFDLLMQDFDELGKELSNA